MLLSGSSESWGRWAGGTTCNRNFEVVGAWPLNAIDEVAVEGVEGRLKLSTGLLMDSENERERKG